MAACGLDAGGRRHDIHHHERRDGAAGRGAKQAFCPIQHHLQSSFPADGAAAPLPPHLCGLAAVLLQLDVIATALTLFRHATTLHHLWGREPQTGPQT
jgi:hypothetical protein